MLYIYHMLTLDDVTVRGIDKYIIRHRIALSSLLSLHTLWQTISTLLLAWGSPSLKC